MWIPTPVLTETEQLIMGGIGIVALIITIIVWRMK